MAGIYLGIVVQAMAVGKCSRNVYWKLFTSCGPGVGTKGSQELGTLP